MLGPTNSDRKASLYKSSQKNGGNTLELPDDDESSIFEDLLGVSLSHDQLDLLDMPPDIREIFLRLVKNQNLNSEEEEKPLTKDEIKVLRVYAKKKLKEVKRLEKQKSKEKKELRRLKQRKSKTTKSDIHTDVPTPPPSEDEWKEPKPVDENDKKEIDYQRSFFSLSIPSQDSNDEEREYKSKETELMQRQELVAIDEDEKFKKKRALAMKEEMKKIDALQEEADAIETMMGKHLMAALANRDQARGIASKTEGMKWKSKEFRKKTSGFLRNLTIKKVLKYLAIGLVIMVVMMIVIGVLMSMMMLFIL